MRDLSAGPSLLSVNTATVRKQAGLLEIIEACAKHGIAAISPWRDQVAAVGLEQAGRAIKDAGLKLSGYCGGGRPAAIRAAGLDALQGHRRRAQDDRGRHRRAFGLRTPSQDATRPGTAA